MTSDRDVVSVERVIAAPAERIFDVLADPARHRDVDGSGRVQGTEGPARRRLALGATFGMAMRQGFHYSMVNEVVEFEEGRRIAWKPRPANPWLARVVGGRLWRYELEPMGDATRVRETWDISAERGRAIVRAALKTRTRRDIERSLERLEALVVA